MAHEWVRATGQTWKLIGAYAGVVLMVASAAAAVAVDDADTGFIAYECATGALIVALLFGLSVRCRVCDEFVLVAAWRTARPLSFVRDLKRCPSCGARSQDERLV